MGDAARSRSIFGERIEALIDRILQERLDRDSALDALRRQYPDYAAALEARFLRQSALRREMGRYQALYEEGLIAPEVYRDLTGGVEDDERARPRFDIGLDTRDLIARLDFFAGLDDRHLERVQKLLRPRFTVPNELIVRKGERGDAMFFHRLRRGRGRLSRPPHPARERRCVRRDGADHRRAATGGRRAKTYCRLLVLRKADFDRFMSDNRDIHQMIYKIAEARASINLSDATRAGLA